MARRRSIAPFAISAQIAPALLAGYDFSSIGVLVDVGGGHGQPLSALLEQYPSMHGVLVDLAHVLVGAEQRIATRGLLHRCDLLPGDVFAAVPYCGDAYLLKHASMTGMIRGPWSSCGTCGRRCRA